MRNATFKLRKHVSVFYWLFVAVLLLTIILAVNQRASLALAASASFNYTQPAFLKRDDYLLAMEKLAKDRSMKYPSNVTYKWLFLTTFGIYRQVMDRHFFSIFEAAKRHPNINATLWGRDFPGSYSSRTVSVG